MQERYVRRPKEDEKCANQSRTLGVALARQPHFPLCLSMCDSCSSGQRSLFLDSHHQTFIWSTRINLKISALHGKTTGQRSVILESRFCFLDSHFIWHDICLVFYIVSQPIFCKYCTIYVSIIFDVFSKFRRTYPMMFFLTCFSSIYVFVRNGTPY